ncbi:MAG: hypothetical protein R3B53_01460 [Candidatus Paceibacterota bacterium]
MPILTKNEDVANMRLNCGKLAVKLLGLTVDKPVEAVRCSTILGGVLPWDAVQTLTKYGVVAEAVVVTGNLQCKIDFLINQIDLGHSVAILTGLASGHWLTVLGYNRNRKEFEVVDTAKNAKRDSRGLTTYTYSQLLEAWGQQSWLQRLLSWYCSHFTWLKERLQAESFTAVALA